MIKSIIPIVAVLVGAMLTNPAGADSRVIYKLGSSDALKFGEHWTQSENTLKYTNDNPWVWEDVTMDSGDIDDYQFDAVISIAQPGFGNDNKGAGFIFRESNGDVAYFYVWQPWGGWSAQGQILGPNNHWSKDQTQGLTKDNEAKDHHLKAIIKGNLANFFVDDELVSVLDITDRPHGKIGIRARHNALFKSLTISTVEPNVKLATSKKVRGVLRNGQVYKSPIEWREIVARSGKIFDEAIEAGTMGVPGEEYMPAFTYRCLHSMRKDTNDFYGYPANHHSVFIDGMLDYYKYTGNRKYLVQAIRLARWEIKHSTPATDYLPYMPYSTSMRDKMGGEGNQDGKAIMVDKAGLMGQAYLTIYKLTGNKELLEGATRIADTLLKIQLPEGRWQNRIENSTGKVIQDYTSNQVYNIQLMEKLYEITADKRYADSAKRALDWVLANPIKDFQWIGFYEDVEVQAKSLGHWDAIETGLYLIANKDKNPKYLKMAMDISDWIGTSFAVDQGNAWSLICEQSVCMPVMSCHTLHYALLLNEIYKATGNEYYKKAAISAANAGFILAKDCENWYSLTVSPLNIGIDLAQDLGL